MRYEGMLLLGTRGRPLSHVLGCPARGRVSHAQSAWTAKGLRISSLPGRSEPLKHRTNFLRKRAAALIGLVVKRVRGLAKQGLRKFVVAPWGCSLPHFVPPTNPGGNEDGLQGPLSDPAPPIDIDVDAWPNRFSIADDISCRRDVLSQVREGRRGIGRCVATGRASNPNAMPKFRHGHELEIVAECCKVTANGGELAIV